MAKGEVKLSFPSLAASLCLPGSRAECTAPPPSRLLRESGRKTEGGSTSHAYLEGDDDDDASMAPLNLWTAISPDGEGDGGEGAAATVMGGIGGIRPMPARRNSEARQPTARHGTPPPRGLGSADARTESGGGGPKENEQWAHFSTKLPIPAQPGSFLSFQQKERKKLGLC
jgi:hypothetical protein